MSDIESTVTLIAPNGQRVTVGESKKAARLANGYRELGNDAEPGKAAEPAPPAAPAGDQAPKGNASRDEWAAYAETKGVEHAPEATRDEIKAAVTAAADAAQQ